MLLGVWAGTTALLTADPVRRAAAVGALDELPPVTPAAGCAVGGGWFGWLGYDAVDLPSSTSTALAFHDWVLRCDADGAWWFEALETPERADAIAGWRERAEAWVHAPPAPVGRTARLTDVATDGVTPHVVAVERVQDAIRDGEVYQANVCTRVRVRVDGDAALLWLDAARQLAPPYAAWLTDGAARAVGGWSPELFLARTGRQVRSRPIKGTRPRSTDPASLTGSDKERAEHVMIVDLIRHDLGRVATVGTVATPELLVVEPHPGVWHLVSTVSATLRDDVGDGDLLAATFPPGSVTGAPKVAARAVIDQVEHWPRRAYTGAYGLVSPLSGLELAVTIRTLELEGDGAWIGVGGGVTAGSIPHAEWRECLDKVGPLVAAGGGALPDPEPTALPLVDVDEGVTTTLLAHDGHALELADHLARLGADDAPTHILVRRTAHRAGPGWHRLRLVRRDGEVTVAVTDRPPPVHVDEQDGLVLVPVVGGHGLGGVKWADREPWFNVEELAGVEPPDGAALMVDADGFVLETSRDAVLVVDRGELWAHPLDGRVLPSVTRRVVLELARDQGIPVRLEAYPYDDLLGADCVFVVNALQGLRWSRLVGNLMWESPDEVTRALSSALLRRWGATA